MKKGMQTTSAITKMNTEKCGDSSVVERNLSKVEVAGAIPALRSKNIYVTMKVSVIGTGNVGVAIAADLSAGGHEVTLIKSSSTKSKAYDRLQSNDNRVFLKEDGKYTKTQIKELTSDLSKAEQSGVIIVTIQSTYHNELYKRLAPYLDSSKVVICICSYLSSFYLTQYCNAVPMIAETTGPYLEGRVEMDDMPGEVVFRVGCRLTNSPLSLFHKHRTEEAMWAIRALYKGFNNSYSVIESALLNPNMVLHTVGAIMSIPRIEFSDGNFCMYREAYSRKNDATLKIMLKLDEEKKQVLKRLGGRPIDIFVAGGFLGEPLESFYSYSESDDRAVSPTSIRSRYITEDVSQGLVLLESIAKQIGVDTPVTTSLIDIAGAALGEDFRANGRTIQKLCAVRYIEHLSE